MRLIIVFLVLIANLDCIHGWKRPHPQGRFSFGINAGINFGIGFGKGCYGRRCRRPPPAPPQIIIIYPPSPAGPPIVIPGPIIPVPTPVTASPPMVTPPPGLYDCCIVDGVQFCNSDRCRNLYNRRRSGWRFI